MFWRLFITLKPPGIKFRQQQYKIVSKKLVFRKKTGDSTSIQWDPEDYLPLSTVAQMERCAKKINITQENLENYIQIDDTTVTDEMSLNRQRQRSRA